MKVFVKRYPSKGELPMQDGLYFTNLSNLGAYYYYKELGRWGGLQPDWWLEEIELPSEEDVTQKVIEQDRSHSHAVDYNNGYDMGFQDCYDFILNHLKSNTNGN